MPDDAYVILANLVASWPDETAASSPELDAARAWLQTRRTADIRTLARDTLGVLDLLLQRLQGGTARDLLFDTREALAKYVHYGAPSPTDAALTVKLTPAGGVTLLRNGQHFTIDDDDLDQVREAINTRRREIRKRLRRQQ